MKNKLFLKSGLFLGLVFAFTSILSLINCKKESSNASCPNKNLTCTVDGNPFQSCVITVVNYPTYAWVQAQGDDNKSSIHLYIPLKTGTFDLGGTSAFSAQYWQGPVLSNVSYLTDTIHKGTVTLTKYDATNKLMSGTFSFDAHQYMPKGTAQKNVTAGVFTDVNW
ncbi:MAG: DUF6252 family protein [Bacteroidia bacterium]